jgi:AraC-like DNA-binding protein
MKDPTMVVSRPGTSSRIEIVHGIPTSHGIYLDSYTFVVVLSGYMALHYKRAAHTALAGDLFLLEAGRTLVARASDDPRSASLAVSVEPALLESLWAPRGPGAPISFESTIVRGPVAEAFTDAVRPVVEDGAGEDSRLLAAIRNAVRARGVSGEGATTESARAVTQGPTIAIAAHRAAAHLHDHVADPVSLDSLATVSCMSKYHLTRLFHSVYGLPPHAYQLQLRLAFAKRLIRRGLSVASAAATAGFAGPVHMHRHFRTRYGVAPGHYSVHQRESHLSDETIAELRRLPFRE